MTNTFEFLTMPITTHEHTTEKSELVCIFICSNLFTVFIL